MSPWTIEESQYVIKHHYLTIRKDVCRTEGGHIVDPFFVLEYPDSVVAVPLDKDGNVLVTRQYRHGVQRDVIELVGGRIEEGETPIAAAIRELSEETGYAAARAECVGTVAVNPSSVTSFANVVVLYDCERVGEPEDNPAERIESWMVSVDEILPMIFNGEFCQAIHISALVMAMKHTGRLTIG